MTINRNGSEIESIATTVPPTVLNIVLHHSSSLPPVATVRQREVQSAGSNGKRIALGTRTKGQDCSI